MNKKIVIVLVILTSLFLSGCLIEDKTGTVSVRVSSSAGGDVEGAQAVIKATGENVVAEGLTDSDGRWEARDVPVGDYTIEVSKEGYSNTCSENKSVGAGRIVVSCTLTPEQTEETIQEILAKAENIESLQFTTVFYETEFQVFQKNNKYRFDTEELRITTDSVEKTYSYSAISDGQNKYYRYKTTGNWPETTPFVDFDLIGLSEKALNDTELKETGKKELNGKNFRIIEFYLDGQTTEAWVSEENGLMTKLVFELATEKFEENFENIKVNSVDDSVFDTTGYKPFP